MLISIIQSIGIGLGSAALALFMFARAGKNRISPFETSLIANIEKGQQRLENLVHQEIAQNRQELSSLSRQGREEIAHALAAFETGMRIELTAAAGTQKNNLELFSSQLAGLAQLHEQKFEQLRSTMQERLQGLQEDNARALEQMRQTVDEKLHATLEKRLGESFQIVSTQLEAVQKGFGEMRTLASGVGDLKKVLTNVKTRGTWGEVQLGALLEELLSPEQFAVNVAPRKNSRERVEFAVKLPGKDSEHVLLPIDAKFPKEDYERLIEAQERSDSVAAEEAIKALETRVKFEARQIREKYICPPHTTDFALMFLPTEGLYAEVIRRPGLCDFIRRECRVVVAGPTTIAALLNSLQMGFRTLAIEKHASQVWITVSSLRQEFSVFGDMLEKTKKKLQEASHTIDDASSKSRTIETKLRRAQEVSGTIPQAEPPHIVPLPPA